MISSHMLRQRLDAVLHKYTMERRIAHINAVKVCMVQLDEVEAFAATHRVHVGSGMNR